MGAPRTLSMLAILSAPARDERSRWPASMHNQVNSHSPLLSMFATSTTHIAPFDPRRGLSTMERTSNATVLAVPRRPSACPSKVLVQIWREYTRDGYGQHAGNLSSVGHIFGVCVNKPARFPHLHAYEENMRQNLKRNALRELRREHVREFQILSTTCECFA